MTAFLIFFSFFLFILAGLTIVPALPVVLFQFLLIFVFAVASSFGVISGGELFVFGIIAGLSLIVDYSAGAVGARLGGAHRRSVFAGIIGGITGSIIFPSFGAFVGVPLFVYVSELFIKKSPEQLIKATGFSLLGVVAGVALNALLAFTTAILFIIFIF